MKAHKHLISGISAAALISLPTLFAQAADTQFDVRIVHTTDIHARIEENAKSSIIGLAKVKTAADEFTAGGDILLTIDSGDLFHGQPIATLTDGEAVAELIKLCGYDLMTPGNHDWCYGKDRLKELVAISGIKCLAGNITDENGDIFFDDELIIKTVEKDGKQLDIGFFGVSDPKLKKMVLPSVTEGLDFNEPAAYANKAAAELKAKGCDVVIGLVHSHYPADLASQVSGVDIWLCGHEHMVIDDDITNKDGQKIHMVESGFYLYSMSTVDVNITAADDGTYKIDSIDTTSLTYEDLKDKEPDTQVTKALADIKNGLADTLTQKVGSTPEDLDGVWEHLRTQPTNLGKAVAGSYILMTGADVGFENAGGIRASVEKGDVTYGDIIGVSPYGNIVVTKQLTGSELKSVVEKNLAMMLACRAADEAGDFDAWPITSGSVLQMAGIYAEYDPDGEDGSRISYMEVGGKALDNDKLYTVATNNYVAENVNYPELAQAEEIAQTGACEQALIEYFRQDESVIANDLAKPVFKEVKPSPEEEEEEEEKPEEEPAQESDPEEPETETEQEPETEEQTEPEDTADIKEENRSSDKGTEQAKSTITENPKTGGFAVLTAIALGGCAAVLSKKRR